MRTIMNSGGYQRRAKRSGECSRLSRFDSHYLIAVSAEVILDAYAQSPTGAGRRCQTPFSHVFRTPAVFNCRPGVGAQQLPGCQDCLDLSRRFAAETATRAWSWGTAAM